MHTGTLKHSTPIQITTRMKSFLPMIGFRPLQLMTPAPAGTSTNPIFQAIPIPSAIKVEQAGYKVVMAYHHAHRTRCLMAPSLLLALQLLHFVNPTRLKLCLPKLDTGLLQQFAPWKSHVVATKGTSQRQERTWKGWQPCRATFSLACQQKRVQSRGNSEGWFR